MSDDEGGEMEYYIYFGQDRDDIPPDVTRVTVHLHPSVKVIEERTSGIAGIQRLCFWERDSRRLGDMHSLLLAYRFVK
jgi:hypothetical protein